MNNTNAHSLVLQPQQAAQSLRLRPRQQLLVHVAEGQLWLTQDGLFEDWLLSVGEQLLLRQPGRYRLGAFGPGRLKLELRDADAADHQ